MTSVFETNERYLLQWNTEVITFHLFCRLSWRSSEVSFLVMDWSNECFFLKVKNIIYMYIYHYMYKTETKQAVLQLWGHTLIIFLGWMVPRYFSTCSTHFQFFYNFFFDHKTEEYIMKTVTLSYIWSRCIRKFGSSTNIIQYIFNCEICKLLYLFIFLIIRVGKKGMWGGGWLIGIIVQKRMYYPILLLITYTKRGIFHKKCIFLAL